MVRLGFLAALTAVLFSCPSCAVALKGIPSNGGIHSVSKSLKYLISSFPNIKTVAYTHLPDTIWRPLFVGNVKNPTAVASDAANSRLYVADPDQNKIFWYGLVIEPDGLLKTDGHQHVAVDGVTAYSLSVNGQGDLYFSGQLIVPVSASSDRSIYRMDEAKIASGDALNPTEVYTRANSGFPTPAVWKPSGVAVDSFNIYWGNEEKGDSNGAVCSGTRQNIGVTSALEINVLTKAVPEVRGMAMAGDSIFYLTPQSVYGAEKTAYSVAELDPSVGQIQGASSVDGWDPKSIAFDGEGTMYWTEAKAGIIYQFPTGDTNAHPLQKYIDAPQVHGVTIFAKTGKPDGLKAIVSDGLKANYGQLQSSARADDSGAVAFHLNALVVALSAAVALMNC